MKTIINGKLCDCDFYENKYGLMFYVDDEKYGWEGKVIDIDRAEGIVTAVDIDDEDTEIEWIVAFR